MPHTLEELEEMLVNPETANQKSTLINVVDDLLQIGPVSIVLARLKAKLHSGEPIDLREKNAFLLSEVRDLKEEAQARGALPEPPPIQRRAGVGALGGKKRKTRRTKRRTQKKLYRK
jgi:hypothetical protein